MKVVAIIQARMGSTRLPGKVLKDIGGETMLARVVRRTQMASSLDQVIIATTVEPSDDVLVAECEHLGVSRFRGDELDVLDRYYQAAKAYEAGVVVRITSDCPLIDPVIIDRVTHAFLNKMPDYASNTLTRTYPRGLDTAVVSMIALAQAWRESTEPYQRTHVMPYIYQNPNLFQILSVRGDIDYTHFRWTVDTQEDLDFVRSVYACLGNVSAFSWHDVIKILSQEPELAELNRHIRQKALKEG